MARWPRVGLVAVENIMADTIARAEMVRTAEKKFKVQTGLIVTVSLGDTQNMNVTVILRHQPEWARRAEVRPSSR